MKLPNVCSLFALPAAALIAASCATDTVAPFWISGRWDVDDGDPGSSIFFDLRQTNSRITGEGSQCAPSSPPGTPCGRYGIIGTADNDSLHLDLAYMSIQGNTSLYHVDARLESAHRIRGLLRSANPGVPPGPGGELILRRAR